ncbi:uridine phosphorylase 1-like isoform X2 [Acanthaster planci]|nr:uridine phosphorylase 1-like isoform X2 [Acanthaster planci]XP_022082684.1 uridine phosphorylase 1-like isoform X2 [Acanthaster planci]XP_022082694.1 uridine phosphorylase 1-like isoform X2 [Acanthaster planci]XP_022082703.1 uridine phosphorylase 1-like isoform X2 [Acanthaster planci]XP_022082710.1 uridine phosphorylase 1-like isoform X2 [Acanthaster planci]
MEMETRAESKSRANNDGSVRPPNPYLEQQEVDVLYHLGLSTDKDPLPARFGDVRFVCMGGSATRMKRFAEFIAQRLGFSDHNGALLTDLCSTDRYNMYKIGCVLAVNHGMGMPSISILLHELIKLVHYAGCKDVVFIRMGTSGGLGLQPGTVVITDTVVNEMFEPAYKLAVLGKIISRPTKLSQELASELLAAHDPGADYAVVTGNTMSTSDFYEGQARIDGAICEHTLEDKMVYLQAAYDAGVRNIEMEASCLAAMCGAAQIKGAVVCVTLLDRLLGDQVTMTEEEHDKWEQRPQELIARFFLNRLRRDALN